MLRAKSKEELVNSPSCDIRFSPTPLILFFVAEMSKTTVCTEGAPELLIRSGQSRCNRSYFSSLFV